jgi:hypothetical protein
MGDAITLRDGHAAVNVKVYHLDSGDAPDSVRERVWDATVQTFWERASEIAHGRGYTGVFSEGRSGGWCVPYSWSKGKPKHYPNGPYSQGPFDEGYPVYPDVAHNSAERERFRAFQRRIRKLLSECKAEYTANVKEETE